MRALISVGHPALRCLWLATAPTPTSDILTCGRNLVVGRCHATAD